MKDEWWFKELGQEFGPVPFDILLDSAKRGLISPTDSVRRPGTKDWVLASSVPELLSACDAHIAQQAEHVLPLSPAPLSPDQLFLPEGRLDVPHKEPEDEELVPGETPLQRRRRKLRARLPRINRVKDEPGFPWLEAILAVSAVSLVFQIFPGAWWAIMGALDVRNWTRTHGLIANVVGLAILFAIIAVQKNRPKQAE